MGPFSHYRTRAIVGKILILLGCVIFVKEILRVWGGGMLEHAVACGTGGDDGLRSGRTYLAGPGQTGRI